MKELELNLSEEELKNTIFNLEHCDCKGREHVCCHIREEDKKVDAIETQEHRLTPADPDKVGG